MLLNIYQIYILLSKDFLQEHFKLKLKLKFALKCRNGAIQITKDASQPTAIILITNKCNKKIQITTKEPKQKQVENSKILPSSNYCYYNRNIFYFRSFSFIYKQKSVDRKQWEGELCLPAHKRHHAKCQNTFGALQATSDT